MALLLELVRDVSEADCTLGWLTCNGRKWPTIERPWVPDAKGRGGRKGVSCVPDAVYRLERHDSDAHPKCWALINPQVDVYHWPAAVPAGRKAYARTVCLIHAANWAAELRGCVAVGKERRKDGRTWMVTRSRDALNELRSAIGMQYDLALKITTGGDEA
jgi:hypothetical protein